MTIEEKLTEIVVDIKKLRVSDELVFAHISKELDFIDNSKKDEQIIITSISTDVPKPTGEDEARGWVRAVVDAAMTLIPGSDKKSSLIAQTRV